MHGRKNSGANGAINNVQLANDRHNKQINNQLMTIPNTTVPRKNPALNYLALREDSRPASETLHARMAKNIKVGASRADEARCRPKKGAEGR
jgi:hypothetical protein